MVYFKLLSKNAKMPRRQHSTAAAFDLYSSELVMIEPGKMAVVETDVAFLMAPEGDNKYVMPRITSLWALAATHNVYVAASDYARDGKGAKVILVNNADRSFLVKPGDAIAQVIFEMMIAVHEISTSPAVVG